MLAQLATFWWCARTSTRLIHTWAGLVGVPYDPMAEGLTALTPEQVATVQSAFARGELDVTP
ncbi:hypothetical protein [Cellulomonas sp. URHD0024]|uniref:hypothetical protein n=1 Tax=Cellulomonas sp. URHD0024 TaxID=1302620 RepID=UPI00040FB984|nr:hypothetical protein [Cellulomonas sp. URHD0024]